VIGYVTAGLGPRAGRATGWMFLAGVVCGAPIVCLIGASYVTDLTGGGQLARAAVAAALLLTVIGLAAAGLRASAAAQLVLVGLLTGVVIVAAAGSAEAARAGNWAPFAPHGWLSVGSAAATLMFSFVGWEAVAPLTTRFADPGRQLPRVVAIALAVTTALYLGLAVATISVLGPRAATDVPLAGLLGHAIGAAGPDIAAVAAIVLTLGATNAYINGAAAMAGQLAHAAPGGRGSGPVLRLLAAIAAAGLLLITLYGLGIVSTAALVAVPTALFLAVYLGAMAAAARVLRGPVRLAAPPAALAVAVTLGFCGWALAVPAAVALAVCSRGLVGARHRAGLLRQVSALGPDALDDAQRGLSREDAGDPETGDGEKLRELGLGALPAAEIDEHRQVVELAQMGVIPWRDDHVDDQYPAAVVHSAGAAAEDGDRAVVVPVVQHPLDDVGIAAGWDRFEHVAAGQLAAADDPLSLQGRACSGDDVRLIEQHPSRSWTGGQNRRDKSSMAPGDVDDRAEAAKVVRRNNSGGFPAGVAGHRVVEQLARFGVAGVVFEHRHAVDPVESGSPGAERPHQFLPRPLHERLADEHRVVTHRATRGVAPERRSERRHRKPAVAGLSEDPAARQRA